MRRNASPRELIASDTLVVNEVVADYYGLGAAVESGFGFVPVSHAREDLGGLLTLPAVSRGSPMAASPIRSSGARGWPGGSSPGHRQIPRRTFPRWKI